MRQPLNHCQTVLSSNELFALLEELIDSIGPERLSEIDTNTRLFENSLMCLS